MVDQVFEATLTGSQTLRLVGELDMATTPVLREALASLPADGGVTLDLSQLSFIDSSGLHALTQYAQSLNGHGPLILANVPHQLAALLDIVDFANHSAIEIQ